jgi:L-asparaginase
LGGKPRISRQKYEIDLAGKLGAIYSYHIFEVEMASMIDDTEYRPLERHVHTMTTNYNTHVHIFSMGGTIDKDYPRLTAGYAFEFGDEPAASRILKAHPNLGITFDVKSICRKDSLDITDDDRGLLFDAIRDILERRSASSQHVRIVITHGTDTMIETAQYVQNHLMKDYSVVLAFTGATKPEKFIDSDASFNLGCAIAATSVCSVGSIVICMNGNVVPAEKCIREVESGLFKYHEGK